MQNENKTPPTPAQVMTDSLKSWMMVILTLVFVLLYVAALFGLIKPLDDTSILNSLEPILFVIIGYYFGRLPAQANEKTLKNEITRQSQKADAAQQLKEKSQAEKEVLEEKIKNAKLTLSPAKTEMLSAKSKNSTTSLESTGNTNQAVKNAVKILDS